MVYMAGMVQMRKSYRLLVRKYLGNTTCKNEEMGKYFVSLFMVCSKTQSIAQII
jgi:hypothetical protein